MNATVSKSYSNRRQQLLPWPIFCQIGPLKAVVKLFKVRKIGDKLIFFLKYTYQRYAESTTPHRGISDGGSRRRRVYTRIFSKSI